MYPSCKGLGLLRLAGLAVRQLDLPRLARPHMEELAELSGETVSLSILTNNDRVMNIDGIASPHMVRNVGWQGREMALHATSGGKVFLAFMDPARVEGIMAKKLEGYTQRTITDPGDLQNELKLGDCGRASVCLFRYHYPVTLTERRGCSGASIPVCVSRYRDRRIQDSS